MTITETSALQIGDRLIFRNSGSIHEHLRKGVPVEIVKLQRRNKYRNGKLWVLWSGDVVELRLAEYPLDCFDRI